MTYGQANSAFSNVVAIPATASRLIVSDPVHAWRESVIRRLEDLIRLEAGWDGYDGVPVTLENAAFALRMLEATCRPEAYAPQIVPGAGGDLQIEWHTSTGDVELHVRSPNSVHAWRQWTDPDDGEEELELTNDFSAVAKWIRKLCEHSNSGGVSPASASAA